MRGQARATATSPSALRGPRKARGAPPDHGGLFGSSDHREGNLTRSRYHRLSVIQRPGREQEPRSEPQRRQPTVPRHRFLTPRCAQASPALGGEQRARRAIALSSHDTRGRRFGWRRCAAALWRLSMPLARAGERPPAWSSPEREGARSPPAPQTRDTDHRAASPIAQTSMAACPLPS